MLPQFNFFFKDDIRWGEQEIIKFRWLLIFILISFIGYRYLIGMKEWALMALTFSLIFIFYNYFLNIVIRRFKSSVWISYFSTTIDILILSGYLYYYGALYDPTAIVTSATVLLYPVLILFSVLRYNGRLVFYSTGLIILVYNSVYLFLRPSIPQSLIDQVDSMGWDGQIFRSSYLALMGYFMFSIPKMVERLVDRQVSVIKEHNERELRLAIEAQQAKSQLGKERELNEKLNRQAELIREQKEKLEVANATKDRLFSIVGHDLRSPFSVQCSLSELLATDHDNMSKEEVLEIVNAINTSAQQGLGLLSNLLDWATVPGDEDFPQTPVGVTSIVQETVALLYNNAKYKNIVIETSIDEDLHICVNRNMLETIIRNLLSNAIKFSPRNSKVEIRAGKDGHSVLISIRDNGVGISEDKINNLFEIGNLSSPGTEDEPGTGVGLLLCKELVEKNNGTIQVDSEPGKGSEFTVKLPVFSQTSEQ